MPNKIESTAVITLANILSGNQVDSGAVFAALEFLCKILPYNYGLVYELANSSQFRLMELYGADPEQKIESFPTEVLSQEQRVTLAQNGVMAITDGPSLSPLEVRLLELHGVKSLALATVIDEMGSIYGFVVLCNPTEKVLIGGEDLKNLTTMLSLLIHYVGGRMYRKRISQSRLAIENMLDNTGIDIYVNDFHTHDILYVNQSMAAPYGGKEAFIGRKCWQVLFPRQTGPCEFCPQNNLTDESGQPTKVYTWDYQRAFDGSWFRVFSAAFDWSDGRLAHVVSSADITDNKHNEAIIENLANFDQLTGLPNRRKLLKDCEQIMGDSSNDNQGYLLFFDIDGFKAINDSFGHDAGDEFLVQLGAFFTGIPLLQGSIYRNGGDEFVALIMGSAISKDHILSLSHFIHERFQKPWCLKNGKVYCNTSIGVACYPEDGADAETLLQKADHAMYKIKKSGGAGMCFGYEI